MIRGYKDKKMYGWVETEQKWKNLDQSRVLGMGIGERGRLLKINYYSDKAYQ